MARYSAATEDQLSYVVVDSANAGRVVRSEADGAPIIFGTSEDAAWYADQLNGMRTQGEILAGV